MQGINTQAAPSASVVLPHYIFAAFSFLVLTVLIFASGNSFIGHYFSPRLLAITHTGTLGWGSMIIFGAMYQLIPAILQIKLFNEILAKITFCIMALGIILLVYSFWIFDTGLPMQAGASLTFVAIVLFCVNIFFTIRKIKNWTLEADYILTSTLWLFLTAAIGLFMTFNFRKVFLEESHLLYLKIHAHVGFIGWFLLLIIGVASKLIPMFLMAHGLNKRKLSISFYMINIGLICLLVYWYLFTDSLLTWIFIIPIVIGIFLFLSYLLQAYNNRLKKGLDIGLKHSLIAFLIVLLSLASGIAACFESKINQDFLSQIILIYGTSILLGFISGLILGQTYKTLPFIVWLHKYKKLLGKQQTPLPKELYSEKIASWQLITYIIASVIFITGIFVSNKTTITFGGFFLMISAVLYNINVFKILFHQTNPRQ